MNSESRSFGRYCNFKLYFNFKATEPHLLETYTPEVTQAYIRSRLESVAVVVRDGLEDPLDDAGMVTQQLDQLSVIGRCEYGKTCQLLVQLFDQVRVCEIGWKT